MTTTTISEQYRALIRAIGAGFHPDTRGSDYASLPDEYTAESYETIVWAAFAAGLDVYGIALDEIHAIEVGQ